MRIRSLLLLILLGFSIQFTHGAEAVELSWLSSGRIERFDHSADLLSDISAGLCLALPALLAADSDLPANTFALSYGGAISLSFGTKTLAKSLIDAPRPDAYRREFGADAAKLYDSFPSGHTTMAFTASSFLTTAAILRPDLLSGNVSLVAAGCTTLAAATGFFRYTSGSHHLVDILTGIALGSLIGSVTSAIVFY